MSAEPVSALRIVEAQGQKQFPVLQVARAFSVYFSQLIHKDYDIFQLNRGTITIDYMALILILLMTCICIYSTKVASEGNIGALATDFGRRTCRKMACAV